MADPEPAAVPMYCLRCGEELPRSGGAECSWCTLQFDPENPATFAAERRVSPVRTYLPGFLLAVASGAASAAALLSAGPMGVALFLSVPVTIGVVVSYATRGSVTLVTILAVLSMAAAILGMIAFGFSGIFCGALASVFAAVPVLVGVVIGIYIRKLLKLTNWKQRFYLPVLLGILAIPFAVAAIERLFPWVPEIAAVSTAADFPEPPEFAWRGIVFYEEVEHPPPLLLRLALPRPLRAQGKKEIGAIVRCDYDRGVLVKRITEVEPERALGFAVIDQRLHFERDVELLGGRFRIEPRPGGGSRVELTTNYRRLLRPAWMWRPVEEAVIQALHRHVLEGMRRRAIEERRIAAR